MTDRTTQNKKTLQKGVAAVELAVVLPLFGILLLGIIEVGGMARDHQALQNAAREGARFSAIQSNNMTGKTTADQTSIRTSIQNRVAAYLLKENITLPPGNVTVNQGYSIAVGGGTANATEITITYDRPVLFPGISRWLTVTNDLQARAVFRNLY